MSTRRSTCPHRIPTDADCAYSGPSTAEVRRAMRPLRSWPAASCAAAAETAPQWPAARRSPVRRRWPPGSPTGAAACQPWGWPAPRVGCLLEYLRAPHSGIRTCGGPASSSPSQADARQPLALLHALRTSSRWLPQDTPFNPLVHRSKDHRPASGLHKDRHVVGQSQRRCQTLGIILPAKDAKADQLFRVVQFGHIGWSTMSTHPDRQAHRPCCGGLAKHDCIFICTRRRSGTVGRVGGHAGRCAYDLGGQHGGRYPQARGATGRTSAGGCASILAIGSRASS